MIIAITGTTTDPNGTQRIMGSGKDTVADFFEKYYGFVKIALADPIKRQVKQTYDFSNQQLWGPSEERNKIDPRYGKCSRDIIKDWGQCGRQYYYDTWARIAVNTARSIEKGFLYEHTSGITKYDGISKHVVVSDLRFANEFEYFENEGAFMIRVKRNSNECFEEDPHPSERDILSIPDNKFNAVVENYGTLDELKKKIDDLYDGFEID